MVSLPSGYGGGDDLHRQFSATEVGGSDRIGGEMKSCDMPTKGKKKMPSFGENNKKKKGFDLSFKAKAKKPSAMGTYK